MNSGKKKRPRSSPATPLAATHETRAACALAARLAIRLGCAAALGTGAGFLKVRTVRHCPNSFHWLEVLKLPRKLRNVKSLDEKIFLSYLC